MSLKSRTKGNQHRLACRVKVTPGTRNQPGDKRTWWSSNGQQLQVPVQSQCVANFFLLTTRLAAALGPEGTDEACAQIGRRSPLADNIAHPPFDCKGLALPRADDIAQLPLGFDCSNPATSRADDIAHALFDRGPATPLCRRYRAPLLAVNIAHPPFDCKGLPPPAQKISRSPRYCKGPDDTAHPPPLIAQTISRTPFDLIAVVQQPPPHSQQKSHPQKNPIHHISPDISATREKSERAAFSHVINGYQYQIHPQRYSPLSTGDIHHPREAHPRVIAPTTHRDRRYPPPAQHLGFFLL